MLQLHYFVNHPYLGYPHEAAAEFGAVMLKFSNRHFDGERAAELFERYHEEYVVAEQVASTLSSSTSTTMRPRRCLPRPTCTRRSLPSSPNA